MLLTLATSSMTGLWRKNGQVKRPLLDAPQFAIGTLRLRGLNVAASALAGWTMRDLDGLRDQADKASCPCLILIEDTPLPLGSIDEAMRAGGIDRVRRLCTAAHRLGCNALAVQCEAADDDESFEACASGLRSALTAAEKLELNLLIAPYEGLTDDPERLTDLIKRIGGFRIGSLPSFGHAATRPDPVAALRKLAPYAGAIHATVRGFTPSGKHKGYDLAECVRAVRSVGFTNTLAIECLGHDNPVPVIERARDILQAAIDVDME